jgi:vacuolar-type H+-ATPase subunit C/Vma6
MNIEIMRNTLYKAYLEDFYKFCQVQYLNMVILMMFTRYS